MKIGTITRINQKGQIVIPKKIRTALNITPNMTLNLILEEKGISLYPIDEVTIKTEKESSYLDLLRKTQGTWKEENWTPIRKQKRQLEISASKRRKKVW